MPSIPPTTHRYKARGPYKRKSLAERFWPKVKKGAPDDCWEWQGARNRRGYGAFARGGQHGQHTTANRMAYELTHGPVPSDMDVCHRCDNPPCCNPSHLFLGSHRDNLDDMLAKGRQSRGDEKSQIMQKSAARGPAHYKARLTPDMVKEIRQMHAAGEMGYLLIGRKFGVSMSTIRHVVLRHTWKDIP